MSCICEGIGRRQNETTKMFSFVEFAQKNLCGFCKPHTKCMDMIEYQKKVLLYSLWNSLPPTANKRKGADTENTETSILPNIAQTIGESTEYSNVGTKKISSCRERPVQSYIWHGL